MSTKIFNLSLPAELVEIIDLQAKLHYATRSEYIKTAILARLELDGAFSKPIEQTLSVTPIASAPQISQNSHESQDAQLEAFLEEYIANNGDI